MWQALWITNVTAGEEWQAVQEWKANWAQPDYAYSDVGLCDSASAFEAVNIVKRVVAIHIDRNLHQRSLSLNCKFGDTYRKTTDSPYVYIIVALKRAVV